MDITHEFMMKGIALNCGLESRKNLLVEEMSELTKVISKMRRFETKDAALASDITKESLEKDFIEELADVNVVLQQCMYLVGEQKVEEVMQSKIERTLYKIENSENSEKT